MMHPRILAVSVVEQALRPDRTDQANLMRKQLAALRALIARDEGDIRFAQRTHYRRQDAAKLADAIERLEA